MATFFMFGKYSHDSVKEISSKRTVATKDLIEKVGGKLEAGFALLGEYDLLLQVEFPGKKEAMKTSVELSKLLGIGFTTAPAISIEEFDKLIG